MYDIVTKLRALACSEWSGTSIRSAAAIVGVSKKHFHAGRLLDIIQKT
jgi:hypothetical protein